MGFEFLLLVVFSLGFYSGYQMDSEPDLPPPAEQSQQVESSDGTDTK
ncbi:hypothetical protein [Pseudobacteriovorax antillogorgiicola]|uniref:Uncharacterized protein n=1 Tax=Pseudobacteriovorax antillogorgiicola TaxID=1513793 RepID=A0A1Y6BS10_9BACT|nr:hypothetical protein [Pseudobacteriovorax antillogorgiicola]TCS53053.1 hypothetical protein EDD56_108104 [Pseudobacteriovorax antillogorgiicola]SMF26403.1 hypothetical protein SAMN06296036_108143 [Pseudobacteriovorax antillogorgiicola]